MKPVFSILFIVAAFSAVAQNTYTDSLQQFQHNYKKDLFSIIKTDTAFVRFYPPDVRYRVTAQVELLPGQPFFDMRTSSGRSKQARRFAKVTFTLNEKSYVLYAYQLAFLLASADNKDDFFIPFIDEGSGNTSYAGGRYLDFKVTDIVNNRLIIDFNKAYNPYCAFTTGFNCPIPPAENTLNITIEAGEKQFAKGH
jgi:uncharacterized protein (DUF1684 family)